MSKKRFSFGKNWMSFINNLNQEQIIQSEKSLREFLGFRNLKGKSFIDVGCGSGLSSLAAYRMGAKTVVSFDADLYSVNCTRYLKDISGNPTNWKILQGSILDTEFVRKLGKYDVVYSWGVLHHTGNMYQGFDMVRKLCKLHAVLFIAIYNRNRGMNALFWGSSDFWLKIKTWYNGFPDWGKIITEWIYIFGLGTALLITLKNPLKYIKKYKSNRGMDFFTDVRDWLGGYPYEFASVEEVVNYFGEKGLKTSKINSNIIGCNEFLMFNYGTDQLLPIRLR